MKDRGLVPVIAALLLALAASLCFAFVPVGSSTSVSSVSSGATTAGPTVVHEESTTLVEENGSHVLVILAVPVALTLAAVAVSRTRRRSGIRVALAFLLWIGCWLGAMSVGIFYMPAAAALGLGAAMTSRPTA